MIYLLLDSSNAFLSVGLKKDNNLIDKISYPCFQKQSEYMAVEIKKILERNKIAPTDINGIMVSIGPGSYTGIRIALTIAKVMSLALSIPLYPVSSLEMNKKINAKSIVLSNARSGRSYIAAYDNAKCILKDQVMSNADVLEFIKTHKEYALIGDLEYLSLQGEKTDVLENMNKLFKNISPINNPDLVKPIYLKESYL